MDELRNIIYTTLWQEFGTGRQSLLEDLARPNAEREVAGFINRDEPTEEDFKRVLNQAIEVSQRELLFRYLNGIHGDALQKGDGLTIGNSYSTTVGMLGNRLVDLSMVSTSSFYANTVTMQSLLPAAAKAAVVRAEEISLAVMDRDSQEWAWFRVRGDFDEALEYMSAVSDAAHMGKKFPLFRGQLRAVPDPETTSIVDRYLWSLNAKESGRKTGVLHPSSLSVSRCERALAYELRGEKPVENVNPKLRRIFDIGHSYHEIIQLALQWALPNFHPEVRGKYKDLYIEGSTDGVINGTPREGIEIKTINNNGFTKLTKPKPEHEEQATIYGIMLDLEAIHYIYVNKDNGDIVVFKKPVDRNVWHGTAAKATNIVKKVEAGELPPQLEGKDYVCRECKFSWICRPELNQNKTRMFAR